MKVSVNSELCEGYGNCERNAPELFELDESGHSRVLNGGRVLEGREELAQYAAKDCPMDAISVEEC